MPGRRAGSQIVIAGTLPLVLVMGALRLAPCQCLHDQVAVAPVAQAACPHHRSVSKPSEATTRLTTTCPCTASVARDQASATAPSERLELAQPASLPVSAQVELAPPGHVSVASLIGSRRDATGPPVFLRVRSFLL